MSASRCLADSSVSSRSCRAASSSCRKRRWTLSIGVGTLDGNRIDFEDLVITRGTGYGNDFDPSDVVRETWGRITLEFSDCNNAVMAVRPLPSQTAFGQFVDIIVTHVDVAGR